MTEKQMILKKIRQLAQSNGGEPPGIGRFERLTGIRSSEWLGVYWVRWSDALTEAGFKPNTLRQRYSDEFLLKCLISCLREVGHYPTAAELRFRATRDAKFPSVGPFRRLGPKRALLNRLIDFCESRPGYDDVLAICQPLADDLAIQEHKRSRAERQDQERLFHQLAEPDLVGQDLPRRRARRSSSRSKRGEPLASRLPAAREFAEDVPRELNAEGRFGPGFVYLFKAGQLHKIGKTDCVKRRLRELAAACPLKLKLVHAIQTDDPQGVESYWHRRFADKRDHGEWFRLNGADVRTFQQREAM